MGDPKFALTDIVEMSKGPKVKKNLRYRRPL